MSIVSPTELQNVGIDQTTPGTTNAVTATGQYNLAGVTLADLARSPVQLSSKGDLLASISYLGVTIGASAPADNLGTGQLGLYTTARAMVYDGTQFVRMRGDTNGISVQSGQSATFWNYPAASGGIVNTTTAVTLKTAAGAGVRNYLKSMQVSHDLLGAATEIAVRDGASGTVLWRGKLQTPAADAALGAGTITFDPPLKGTANTLMEFVVLTAVTGGVFVNATGYTGT